MQILSDYLNLNRNDVWPCVICTTQRATSRTFSSTFRWFSALNTILREKRIFLLDPICDHDSYFSVRCHDSRRYRIIKQVIILRELRLKKCTKLNQNENSIKIFALRTRLVKDISVLVFIFINFRILFRTHIRPFLLFFE